MGCLIVKMYDYHKVLSGLYSTRVIAQTAGPPEPLMDSGRLILPTGGFRSVIFGSFWLVYVRLMR